MSERPNELDPGSPAPASLDAVVTTAELARRPARPPDHAAENSALVALARAMAEAPDAVLQQLADAALELCRAGSAGVSLAERDGDREVFRWHATAGAFAPYRGGTMPRAFSPCGTVLDRNATQLMADPARHFPPVAALTPAVAEVLLVPFYRGGTAVGTVWVAAHDPGRLFDAEDARVVTSLAGFAAVAVQARERDRDGRRADERARTILDSITDAFIGLDRGWRFTYVNPRAEGLLGRPAADIVGKDYWAEFPGSRGTAFEAAYRRTMADGVPLSVTDYYADHDRWYEVHAYPAPDGISVYFRDVSERRRAEDQLRASEERVRLAVEAAGVGYWEWDLATDRCRVDATCAALFDVGTETTGAELLGRIVAADRAATDAAVRATVEGARAYDAEFRVRRRDGSVRWLAGRGNVTRDAAGRPARLVGVNTDVTDRKRTEATSWASEERFRFLDRLGQETRGLADAGAVMAATARLLGDHLGVTRTAFADVDADGDRFTIRHDWTAPGAASTVGVYSLDLFGLRAAAKMRAGRPLVVRDVDAELAPGEGAEAFNAIGIKAIVCCPLVKGGRLVAMMAVHSAAPRDWAAAEVALVEEVVERSWAHVERVRDAAALRETGDRLNLLVENVKDYAVVLLDTGGTVVEWTAGAERITGWSAAEAVGESGRLLFTPEDVAAGVHEAEMRKAASEGRAEDKRWHQTRSGGTFYADGVMAPLHAEGGELRGYGKVFRDATVQKWAEDELARVSAASDRQRRLYETVLSATPDFVYVFGLDHTVLYANDALIAMWGRGRDGAVGKTFLEIGYEPWHAALHDREIDQVAATRQPVRGEVPFAGTHGRRIYDYIFVPVFGAAGEVEAVAGTTRDVTDRKAAEEALRDADRRKDEFLATLAHELRNPLAPVRTGLQILKVAGGTEKGAKALAMMERQVAHMVRLVDDLMDVSRITRGKVDLRRQRIDLRAALDSALETSRPLIEAAGHEFAVRLPDGPLALDADPTRLAQVFANLLNNAAKYTPEGGRLELAVEREGGEAVVRVSDTGVGIPADMLPKVFDMFTQVGRSIDRSQGGLGIGLTLVRRLVEMHGGTAAADSPGPGAGSTFTVRLPLARAGGGPAAGEATDGGRADGAAGRLRVLVVDDNVDGAESLAMLLQMTGHESVTAHTGPTALTAAAFFRPDLVFLDIGLPGLNGYEVAARLRATPGPVRPLLVALTGWGSEEDRRQSRAAGFDHHLTKPVDAAEVARLLRGLTPGAG